MLHTKETIQELLDNNNRAVVKALLAIHSRQTAAEQAGHHTREVNGVGFSKFDAPFLTDMVRAVQRYGSLTPKQMAVTRNKMKRYWRQLLEVANSRPERTASRPDEEFSRTVAAVSADKLPRYEAWCNCENYDGERKCDYCLDIQAKNEFAAQEARQEAAAFMADPDYADRYVERGT